MAMFDDLDDGNDLTVPPLGAGDPLADLEGISSDPNRTGGGDTSTVWPVVDISARRAFEGPLGGSLDGSAVVLPLISPSLGDPLGAGAVNAHPTSHPASHSIPHPGPPQSNGNGSGKRRAAKSESNGKAGDDDNRDDISDPPPPAPVDLSLPSLSSWTGAEETIALRKWDAIAAHLTEWFHDFDLDALKIAFATMVSHQFSQDDPVWIFIVGPAGTGKTVVINMISALPRTTVMGDLTPQTLLSGYNKGKGFSLLNTLGDSFVLLFKDFTTFLSKRPETRGEIASQLREVYDGKIARNTGASKSLIWSGKCTTICAVTPAVERAWTLMRDLGERFCTVRWPRGDGPAMAEKSMAQLGRGKIIMDQLKEMTVDLWNCVPMRAAQIPNASTNIDLIYLAEMVSHLRGHVQRNAEGKHEISEVPEVEGPTRLAKAFTQIARGHASLMRRRECNDEDLRLARRLALDTIPSSRRRIWEGMLRMPYSDTNAELLEVETGVPLGTVKWILEDFAALGIVKAMEVGTERKDYWFTESFDNIQKKALPLMFADREKKKAEARERRKER